MSKKTKTINFDEIDNRTRYTHLTTAVAPRPIAFASTVDRNGKVNLSPFSYFNVFSSTPPIVVFSPARSGRDNSTKNTYDNVKEVPEVVINIVNHPMVEQMSLSSGAYEKGVNEFEKAGFTEVASDLVKPPRVKESPVSFECVVDDVIELGEEGGAGNLVIARIKLAHIDEQFLNDENELDQVKLDLVARMGGSWYCRANQNSMFEIDKPGRDLGIGVDNLPEYISRSSILSGNDIGRLGNVSALPTGNEIREAEQLDEVKKVVQRTNGDSAAIKKEIQHLGKQMIENGDVALALALMMIDPDSKK